MCPSLKSDMNGDGLLTIADLWLVVSWLYHWPSNKLIELFLPDPTTTEHLEMASRYCSGWFSSAVATALWIGCYGMAIHLMSRKRTQ